MYYKNLVKSFRKKELDEYAKNDKNIFDKIHTVTRNCKYMEKLNEKGKALQINPMTKVYKIVDELKKIFRIKYYRKKQNMKVIDCYKIILLF